MLSVRRFKRFCAVGVYDTCGPKKEGKAAQLSKAKFTDMKKILLSLTILSAVIFSACSSKKEDTGREMVFLNDSLYRSSVNTDTAALVQEAPEQSAPYVATRQAAPKRVAPQKSRTVRNNPQPVYEPTVATPPAVITPLPKPEATGETAPAKGTGTETASNDGTTTGAETPAKKTGMSKGAKGAIIGGVGGAVAGAVIGKNAKGAGIGAAVGAAGGYIIGRSKDKKDGRVKN